MSPDHLTTPNLGAAAVSAARMGIDLGGTKIEGVVLDSAGEERARRRVQSPRGDYDATIEAIAAMVQNLDRDAGCNVTPGLGIGMPGSLAPGTETVQNANSTWLNGKPFGRDIETALRRPVRLANDANCFTLSEVTDGAAQGARSVFGVILGTGCGGGLVVDGRLIDGPRGIGGEWGHNPLPWADTGEHPGRRCWCGRFGCMETWVSGPALAEDHALATGLYVDAASIAERAARGDGLARASLDRHASRLARGLAHVVNLFDPEIIVLGGGLSKLDYLYTELPRRMAPFVFAAEPFVRVVPPRWGDASGVRGAARLWPVDGGT